MKYSVSPLDRQLDISWTLSEAIVDEIYILSFPHVSITTQINEVFLIPSKSSVTFLLQERQAFSLSFQTNKAVKILGTSCRDALG